jgi:hypothetical protein
MIVRIPGEGQFDVAGEHLGELNLLDARLQSAAEAGDEAAVTAALQALRDAVHRLGDPVPADALVASELVLPRPGHQPGPGTRPARRRGPDSRVSGERTRFQPTFRACRRSC